MTSPMGPHTWQVCEMCNLNIHYCTFCGEDLPHAQSLQAEHYVECRPDLWITALVNLFGHNKHYMDAFGAPAQ